MDYSDDGLERTLPRKRPQVMLAALALFAVTPFPSGAYGMPELCQKLTAATGIVHRSASPLEDYPVFVSVKSGDPARVESLVASALHAEWVKEDGKLKLTPIKPKSKDEGFDAWEKLAKSTLTGPGWAGLPLAEMYAAPCGTTFRYCDPPHPFFGKLPKEAAALMKVDPDGNRLVMLRKMSSGFLMGTDQRLVRGLSDEVVKAMGSKANAIALTPETKNAIKGLSSDRAELMKLVTGLGKRDVGAALNQHLLAPTAECLDIDFATVLPDSSLISISEAPAGPGTVKDVLYAYSVSVDFEVVDGAILGRIPLCERLQPSQCRRSALQWVSTYCKPGDVIRLATWADYLTRQRASSSESWSDAYVLLLTGIEIEQSHIADYPYNLRLGIRFTDHDWQLVRSGSSFPATQLSGPVQQSLSSLLVNSLANFNEWHPMPVMWPSIEPQFLDIIPKIEEEPIVLQTNTENNLAGEITSAKAAGSTYKWRKERSKAEPLYQVGHRTQVTLTVRYRGSTNEATTGFSDVIVDTRTKPVAWNQLPEPFRSQFEEGRLHGNLSDTAAPAAAEAPAKASP